MLPYQKHRVVALTDSAAQTEITRTTCLSSKLSLLLEKIHFTQCFILYFLWFHEAILRTNTRLVCTQINAFSMLNTNIEMIIWISKMLKKKKKNCRLHSTLTFVMRRLTWPQEVQENMLYWGLSKLKYHQHTYYFFVAYKMFCGSFKSFPVSGTVYNKTSQNPIDGAHPQFSAERDGWMKQGFEACEGRHHVFQQFSEQAGQYISLIEAVTKLQQLCLSVRAGIMFSDSSQRRQDAYLICFGWGSHDVTHCSSSLLKKIPEWLCWLTQY